MLNDEQNCYRGALQSQYSNNIVDTKHYTE